MTGVEQAQYQKVPTDESEAQTLASADLDYMKSERGRRGQGELGGGVPSPPCGADPRPSPGRGAGGGTELLPACGIPPVPSHNPSPPPGPRVDPLPHPARAHCLPRVPSPRQASPSHLPAYPWPCLLSSPPWLLAGHRFEDVPGVRRHLVRKSTKGQIVHVSKEHREPSARHRKHDRQPHEVGAGAWGRVWEWGGSSGTCRFQGAGWAMVRDPPGVPLTRAPTWP